MYGWCFDKRCCEEEAVERIIVICHDRVVTTAGTGSVSRLDENLSPLWTYDLGTDSGSGRNKRAMCCRIISNGDVYVSWDVGSMTATFGRGMLYDDQVGSTGYTAGGVVKLDKDGNLLASYTHGARRSTYAPSNFSFKIIGGVSVDVDPNDETKVWFGSLIDGNSDWLHLLDDDLTLVSSFGAAEYSLSTTNAICSRIKVDHDGNCWNRVQAPSASGPRINAIDSTGTVNYTGTNDMPGSCYDFNLDDVSDIVIFTQPYQIGVEYMRMRTFQSITDADAFPTWSKSYDDYIYTDFQGRWVTRNQITITCLAANGRAMFHHTNPDLPHWEWPASTYHKDRNGTLFRINQTSGVVEYAEVSGDTDGGNINKQNGNRCRMAYDPGLGNGGFLLAVYSRGRQSGATDDYLFPIHERSFGASLGVSGSGFVQGSNCGVDQSAYSLFPIHWGDVRTIAA